MRMGARLSMSNTLGRVFTTQYDAVGQMIGTLDPLGRQNTLTYYPNGELQTEETWGGNTIQRSRNSYGQLTRVAPRLGDQYDLAYNVAGQVSSCALSYLKSPLPGILCEEHYDPTGKFLAGTDEFGNRYTFSYDNAHRMTALQDTLGNQTFSEHDDTGAIQRRYVAPGLTDVTDYFYDLAGRPQAQQDARGDRATLSYHPVSGRVSAFTDESSAQTVFFYDQFGRHCATQDTRNFVTTINYDDMGRVAGTTDPLGLRSTTLYDSLNRPVEFIDPMGRHTTLVYGTMTYDAATRFVQQTDPLGFVTTQMYTTQGQVQVSIDALGRRTTYGYDSFNREVTRCNARNFVFTTVYDSDTSLDRVVAHVNPRGYCATYIYDGDGVHAPVINRLLAVQDARGYLTTTVYDANGPPCRGSKCAWLSPDHGVRHL